uniref:Armadillo repeat-containing protein 7 n=1 Tax=Palpitomonas bilix TaxID=652834 RepID=A0A7S3G7Z6_9EUKA
METLHTTQRKGMFHTSEGVKRKRGKSGTSREDYLHSLVEGVRKAGTIEEKRKILAHLGNFAYDPLNFDVLIECRALSLWANVLKKEEDVKCKQYAIAAISNVCVDPRFGSEVFNHSFLSVCSCLSSTDEETVLSALSVLYYLRSPATKRALQQKELVAAVQRLANAKKPRVRSTAGALLRHISA